MASMSLGWTLGKSSGKRTEDSVGFSRGTKRRVSFEEGWRIAMELDTPAFWELVTGCSYHAFEMYIFF